MWYIRKFAISAKQIFEYLIISQQRKVFENALKVLVCHDRKMHLNETSINVVRCDR